ncbi:unnamed protein product [Paramecium sonneborni]|uniref:SPRY domain-containing protein n=1 Tax=Paramecium sonneborni TaxID=65129 RepID=A0A8S1R2C1_9CILI|nr:unnamed protein product [Paramecium sonneborni]
MNNFTHRCSLDGHNQIVQFFCFNETCHHIRLCCFECYQEGNHFGHPKDVKQASNFLQFIQQTTEFCEEFINNIQKLMDNLQKIFNEFKIKLQNKYIQSVEQLQKQSINQISSYISDAIQFQKEKNQHYQSIFQCINNFQQIITDFNSELKLPSLVEQLQQNSFDQQISNKQQIENKQIYIGFSQIKLLQFVLQSQFQKQLTFSTKYKHRESKVSLNGKMAENGGSCLCDQMIPINQITRFVFQIENSQQCYIGVGFREIMKQNYSSVGVNSGSYLIRNDQKFYSHHEQQNILPFSFKDQDIIIIEVNMKTLQVKWIMASSGESFSLELQESNGLYPCIRAGNISSKVRILEALN